MASYMVTVCDRCRKELSPLSMSTKLRFGRKNDKKTYWFGMGGRERELCPTCARELYDWFRSEPEPLDIVDTLKAAGVEVEK